MVYRLQDYASAQNLHPGYLSAVIKAKTGKPIHTWIAEKSTAVAKAMLQHSSIPVKEIAYKLGFSDTAHFSNHFKKNSGFTPSSYRENTTTN